MITFLTRVRRPASSFPAGFTLLETILALALSVILVGLIGSGLQIYSRVVSDRRADVVNAQVARVILQRIASDLQATYSRADEGDGQTIAASGSDPLDDGTEGGTDLGSEDDLLDATADLTSSTAQANPGIYGNQAELQADILGQFAKPLKYDMLTAAGVDAMSANLLSEPKIVTYYLREADDSELVGTPLQSVTGASQRRLVLVRRVQSRAQAVFDSAAATAGGGMTAALGEQLLSDQVASIQFSYHDGYDWLDTWDSSLLGMPLAVNITITVVSETSTESVDMNTLTTDNVFQRTVRIPTAELPAEEDLSADGGI